MDVYSRIAGLGKRCRAASGGVPTFGAAGRGKRSSGVADNRRFDSSGDGSDYGRGGSKRCIVSRGIDFGAIDSGAIDSGQRGRPAGCSTAGSGVYRTGADGFDFAAAHYHGSGGGSLH